MSSHGVEDIDRIPGQSGMPLFCGMWDETHVFICIIGPYRM
jgi:hypothetical protein